MENLDDYEMVFSETKTFPSIKWTFCRKFYLKILLENFWWMFLKKTFKTKLK